MRTADLCEDKTEIFNCFTYCLSRVISCSSDSSMVWYRNYSIQQHHLNELPGLFWNPAHSSDHSFSCQISLWWKWTDNSQARVRDMSVKGHWTICFISKTFLTLPTLGPNTTNFLLLTKLNDILIQSTLCVIILSFSCCNK